MAEDACNVDTHKVFNSNLCCHYDILIPDADFSNRVKYISNK